MLVHFAIERDTTATVEPRFGEDLLVLALYYDKEPETDEHFQKDAERASALLNKNINITGSELKPNKISKMSKLLRYEHRCTV
jgi:hypothetical protein